MAQTGAVEVEINVDASRFKEAMDRISREVAAAVGSPTRHPASEVFHRILTEMGELHDRKQADYGRGDDPFANVRASTEWGVPAWVGAMVRATDKLRRLQTFAEKGELANEGVIDSFMDLAVYAIIARVLYEQDFTSDKAEQAGSGDRYTPIPCPDAPVCQTCPCAADDDVCLPEEAHREWRRQRGYVDSDALGDTNRTLKAFGVKPLDPDPCDCSECGCLTEDHACEPCGLGF